MTENRRLESGADQLEPDAQGGPDVQAGPDAQRGPDAQTTEPGVRTPGVRASLAMDAGPVAQAWPAARPEPVAQTDLAAYKAPLLNRAMAGTAESLAACVDGGRRACEGITRFIRNRVSEVIQKEKEVNGIRRGILKAISSVLLALDKGSMRLRLTERIPIQRMPPLILNDDDADALFKGDVNDSLDSRIFGDLPFIDGIEPIARQAFDKGILPEALIRYLESEEILELIVHEILTVADSRFRSSNLVATVWSLFKGAARRLRSFAGRQRKQPITGEIEERLKANLEFVQTSYNPADIDHTIARLIQKLRDDYNDYDIDTWLKKNKKILMRILLGKELGSEGASNISRIVYEIFERRGKGGKEKLKEFIKFRLPLFISYKRDPSEISFLKRMFTVQERECEPVIILDLEFLKTFFGDEIPRVQGKDDSLAELRNMIIKAVEEMIDAEYPEVHNIIIRPAYELVPLENNSSLKRNLAELIKNATQTLNSHVDMAELLADPTESSLAIETAYIQCFTEDGEPREGKKEEAFYGHLRSMVGVIDEIEEKGILAIRKERFDTIERRLKECLRGADAILAELDRTLGLPAEIQFDNIKGEEDYATLVKIAHTAETLPERFAARCKLELAMVYFSVKYAPRSRFQEHDAKQLRLRLENSPHGVVINREEPLHDVHFLDKRNGEVEILESMEQEPSVAAPEDAVTEDADTLIIPELRTIQLIPGKFGKTECWFAPVARDKEEIDKERAYIDSKSDVSQALKVIRRDETRAKDITDITRMTIVVDSQTAMDEIRKQIESDYLSFGQVIKTENLYPGFVRVKTTANVGRNAAKSEQYNALRYVVDMPIRSGDGEEIYLAPIEIRVLFVEDYVKEKSHYHPASHERYERERARVCARKLRPQEVLPELYQEICPFTGKPGPDRNDPWQRTKVVLKDSEDFKVREAA